MKARQFGPFLLNKINKETEFLSSCHVNVMESQNILVIEDLSQNDSFLFTLIGF